MGVKRFFKRADIILIVVIFLITGITFIPKLSDSSSETKTAVVYKNGEIVYEIDLESVKDSYEIDLDTEPDNILLVENGRIRYYKSDCPDQICVNTGWLSRISDVAACVPAKTAVVIIGTSQTDEPDVITY